MTAKITQLGKYTLSEQLGSGGFGTVYKATDSIGRNVAVKVLKPGWSDDPGAIERFRREAQVAGELFHSRIATIIDFDEAEGRLFLVMRYIDGIPLDKLIKEKGRIPWGPALQILEQAAEGLDYAHQRGFVHRDIKPANILVSAKEGAVLTDFGLVKAAVASGMSTSGVMIGTPQYIAPEIWEGKPAAPETDIYSLACVAYEMLTGQVLFAGVSPPEIMTKHMQSAPPLPQAWPPGVPPGIGDVLLRALQRDPAQRYASSAAFVLDLKKQEAGLRQQVDAQAQALVIDAEALLAKGELSQAQEKLSQAAGLAPDLPGITNLEKKLANAARLNGLYGEAVEHYELAQERARGVLAENPAYPDAKGIFPKLGLRGGQTPKATPQTVGVAKTAVKNAGTTKPAQENTDLRWQEKTMPYLLIVLGLATILFVGVGLIGVVAGIGLFWRKNWARRAGILFAGLLEGVSFATIFSLIGDMAIRQIDESQIFAYITISGIGCAVILLALYLIQILGGERLANWMGATPIRPAGIWIIFVAYLVSIIGIIPAILLLVRKPAARVWAQSYAIFLFIALPIVGVIAATNMKYYRYSWSADTGGMYDRGWNNGSGQIVTILITILFWALSMLTIRYLSKPEIRAYYENKEGQA